MAGPTQIAPARDSGSDYTRVVRVSFCSSSTTTTGRDLIHPRFRFLGLWFWAEGLGLKLLQGFTAEPEWENMPAPSSEPPYTLTSNTRKMVPEYSTP